MIISDLEILEVVEVANVQGGLVARTYNQTDNITVNFTSNNSFNTNINDPRAGGNAASAGAKGDAQNNTSGFFFVPTYSFTKADTVAVTELGGGSFSQSSSAAVINSIFNAA
ncbi:hypothetical protein NOS3756_46410 [Nostoc sp. NIES-3756]|uniref:hypothetical protein n=1 Tax=Nostoc sp. NIES-3756 TaxID=1751286 RepID=UPI000721588F|nr:hypothetical protein [Nostoc sp. NIES-3756]BAT55648.1 hypothetical protein NOS3756_46410 [Nostoc sp. NIES-3756]